MNVSVFIDGFNLFYCLKAANFKWLDIASLCDSLPKAGRIVTRIHYFTAMVDGVGDASRPKRQRDYIEAVQMDPRVTVIRGNFFNKTVNGPVERLMIPESTITTLTPPALLFRGLHSISDPYGKSRNLAVYAKRDTITKTPPPLPFAQVHTREEKGTDVNLASHLLLAGFRGDYDQAIVITNDSDLCEPVRIVKEELGKEVTVCYVPRHRSIDFKSPQLHKAASGTIHLTWPRLRKHPLPNQVTLASGAVITKPSKWT